jgi:hypothetical protein
VCVRGGGGGGGLIASCVFCCPLQGYIPLVSAPTRLSCSHFITVTPPHVCIRCLADLQNKPHERTYTKKLKRIPGTLSLKAQRLGPLEHCPHTLTPTLFPVKPWIDREALLTLEVREFVPRPVFRPHRTCVPTLPHPPTPHNHHFTLSPLSPPFSSIHLLVLPP